MVMEQGFRVSTLCIVLGRSQDCSLRFYWEWETGPNPLTDRLKVTKISQPQEYFLQPQSGNGDENIGGVSPFVTEVAFLPSHYSSNCSVSPGFSSKVFSRNPIVIGATALGRVLTFS